MDETLDFYCDSVNFEVGAYGFSLALGKSQPPARPEEQPGMRVLARAHMSPQHAKVLAKLFVMNVKRYEEQFGEIELPNALYQSMGLPAEW
ncbi:MAG TPA: DUF3467 domain-containing protein [Dehalococcoidia bacterium]|jgi:hypothetical protein|nr:DUF3467 domain-containing protein [Dehalococcoidia bacterium]